MVPMTTLWDDVGGLTSAYERFLAGGTVAADVRASILTSWQRCKTLGLVPNQLEIPYEEDLDLEGHLLHAAEPVLDQLEAALTGTRVSIIFTDRQARVIQRRAGDPALNKSLDAVQLAVGFSFAEPIAGTNGIGTALTERRPCFVVGREHFAECMAPFACAGAPIRNPLSGRVEGVLDLTCLRTDANPAMVTLVRKAAGDIEQRLLEQTATRERELLKAFMDSRSQGQQPGGPAPPGPVGLPHALGDRLGRGDQALLRQKAAELISSPNQSTAQVVLSDGQVAVLRCRSVTEPSGRVGVAVEARIPAADLGHTMPVVPGFGAAQSAKGVSGAPAEGATPCGPPQIIEGPSQVIETPRVIETPKVIETPQAIETPEVIETSRIIETPTQPTYNGVCTADSVGTIPVTAPAGGSNEWLLLLGEPGVGELAVQARQRLELLFDAGVHVGTTLDVTRTAEELAEVAVPQLADFVTVDLLEPVLDGAEPVPDHDGIRRAAVAGVCEEPLLIEVGESIDLVPSTPQARSLVTRQSILEPVLSEAPGWQAQDPPRLAKILEAGFHSLMVVAMHARGTILGVVSFYRSEHPDAFVEDDIMLAEELVGRAALCIDNARRYTREHAVALALQRSLLPRGLPSHSAVEVAHRYLPAYAGVGGDWYDVIPLSGARVALVVGDVVGHGVHAAATMGRLRTAVHNFSSLDLPADDLLSCLNDLVEGLDADQEMAGTEVDSNSQIVGATCLYAVYDPVSRHCTLARAGHPLPALVLPDGSVEFPEVPAGPPLGLGGLPFETVELEIPEGSELVLYSDGLIEDRTRDIDVGLELLRNALSEPGRPPEETCSAVLEALLPTRPSDDVALLVARMKALDAQQVAVWDVAPDSESVPHTRAAVARQLECWGLEEELVCTGELLVSELLTNAIRHARGPIQVRLLRDRTLICEVSDGSSTSPRMRRAGTSDEGGRGLFLIAQLTPRWGTRYTAGGKVIWAELPLPSTPRPLKPSPPCRKAAVQPAPATGSTSPTIPSRRPTPSTRDVPAPQRGPVAMHVEDLFRPTPIKEFTPLPRALLGPGSHERVGPEAQRLGFRRALVVTSGLRGTDIVQRIVDSGKYHGVEFVVYDKVESNPKDYNVMDAAAAFREHKCDSFVSIGGGSSHDACKGARLSLAHDGRSINEFEGYHKSENPNNPPHIAVSTTAGTGSETTSLFVITDTTTDPDQPHKYAAFDRTARVTLAIDDPVLYYECPVDYTAQCGIDVLTHASEAYVSRLDFTPSMGSALQGIELASRYLRTATWNGRDLAAREGMMYGQYVAAQAFNSGGLGLAHSISHAVSAFYDLHHGLNNAILLPRVWAFNMPVAYERFADIARAMGVDTSGMTVVQAADAALAALIRLIRDLGLPERFNDVKQDTYSKNRLGMGPTEFYQRSGQIRGDDADVDRITRHTLGDSCVPTNTKESTYDTVRPLVQHCMDGSLDDLTT
ncbi:MAG: iron-containing alcohol dehydrogenase [Streptomycetaceae bacterium]|nr:iron-containing alcohol dehydrogenase [Streptomycetaceae bacterium]